MSIRTKICENKCPYCLSVDRKKGKEKINGTYLLIEFRCNSCGRDYLEKFLISYVDTEFDLEQPSQTVDKKIESI